LSKTSVTVSTSKTVTLTITTSMSATLGTYTLIISGTSKAATRTASVSLQVK
jgi:uncharacterized membrane protein